MVTMALWNLNTVGATGGVFITNSDTRKTSGHFNDPHIKPGEFRPLDVSEPPLNLPDRLHSVISSTKFEVDDTWRFPLNVSGLPYDADAKRFVDAHPRRRRRRRSKS